MADAQGLAFLRVALTDDHGASDSAAPDLVTVEV